MIPVLRRLTLFRRLTLSCCAFVAMALFSLVCCMASVAYAQGPAAPEITSSGPFSVDEGVTAVATLTADDSDTAIGDLVWSMTGGEDSGAFTLSNGVLAFAAAKDYESPDDFDMDGTFLVTVQVSDGDNTDSAELVVNLGNVIELTTIQGPSSVDAAENDRGRLATFTASSDADRDGIEWTLSGTDAAHFSIGSPPGALRFQIEPVSPKLFPEPPDFEAPQDSGTDNTYDMTIMATATGGASTSHAIAVTVTDEDEDGTITLSTTVPRVGQSFSASLSDPDAVSGAISWKWERSAGRNAWAIIEAATGSSHVPVAADTGEYLRVTATYGDGHGTAKSVSAALPNVAAGRGLDSLSVTTNDSAGGVDWRQMRPAFSSLTLHYSIGCGDTDTMTVTFAAADASSRLAVNAITYANPGAGQPVTATVSVGAHSDVEISVTGEGGGETQYVVHCLAADFTKVTSEKSPGATEELLLVPLDQLPVYSR